MTDADHIIQTLHRARALARTWRDPELADACVKSVERVAALEKRANGWASQFPRGENETSRTDRHESE